ncbi:MAG: hypothetical protein K2P93_00570 [Alphaproteobacteria bacterium]|nr:hypothetical protein [Alphaproteobacteria bacterium]
MKYLRFFVLCLALIPYDLHAEEASETSLCDPEKEITTNITIEVDTPFIKDLKARGVQELVITPVMDFSWEKTFSLKNEAVIAVQGVAEDITIDMQMGLLVAYKKGDEYLLYAYCQVENEDLKGEFPKELKLHLNPGLNQCVIEVVKTQCPTLPSKDKKATKS